jgi:hypothetical protein
VKERNYLGELKFDEGITLKQILRPHGVKMQVWFN